MPPLRVSSAVVLSALLVVAVTPTATASLRSITFEERVAAQEAIERVYYSHQIGATRPFDEAVPREALELKVRNYLQESVALERFWKTPVTPDALRAELRRIARQTRSPERLLEIYQALGNDALLIHECFARPVLVDRLARSFFAFDQGIHASARAGAEQLRGQLLDGALSPFAPDPRRTEVEVRRRIDGEDQPDRVHPDRSAIGTREGARLLELRPGEFERVRAYAPVEVGEVGAVIEEQEAFVISVVLAEGGGSARIATYAVGKQAWDEWWRAATRRLDRFPVVVGGEASERFYLPAPGDGSGVPLDRRLGASPATETVQPPPGSCPGDDAWDNGSLDDLPSGRVGHTAVWTGTQMVVWGGYDPRSGQYDTGARYDPVTDRWTATSREGAPSGQGASTKAVWTGSVMIIWGGTSSDPGGRYDPIADTWLPVSPVGAPSRRSGDTAVWTGSEMIVWGGLDLSYNYVSTGGRYNPVSDTWRPTSFADAPTGRSYHTAVWTGSVMVIWGGYGGALLNTGGRYDPVSNTWSPTSTFQAPSARSGHTGVWASNRMVVWGGVENNSPPVYTNTGGRYDPLTDAWTAVATSNAPVARGSHTAVDGGNLMIVWGGYSPNSPSGGYLGTGGRYDVAANAWLPTSTHNAPSARAFHTATWTGSLMIVWGGEDSPNHALGTGGRYDPLQDNWTPTSSAGAPSPRAFHSAIWTGSLMIIWGGGDGPFLSPSSTGGRYDPLTDSWTPTSLAGAPSPRRRHTASWTGTLMVIWGGNDSNHNALNTGGRYDPATDTWLPMSTNGAPLQRSGHTAVWTGTLMIVWGGEGTSDLNSGGRYDPSSDTWTQTSTAGAPSPRRGYSAVWTGSQMIVWGGHDGAYANTGGRYDPVTDRWSQTSTDGAPSARYLPTAVWTGDRMVVWGGSGDSPFYLNTGGLYDPATDEWTPTSTESAPSGRRAHTAVWSGSLMVVWGGSPGQFASIYLDSGGRYDPVADVWTPTSTIEAPSGRAWHTAVWAGSSMIVWGGQDDVYSQFGKGDGGRYIVPEGRDGDGDGVDDGCDNCQGLGNPGQEDADGDRIGDACDLCPGLAGPGGEDGDADGVGHGCDTCPTVANPDQADANGDGSGDACQPVVTIGEIRQDGGADLEVRATLHDPQGELLTGTVELAGPLPSQEIELQDIGFTFDCALGYSPEGVPGEGIAFLNGSVGFPFLVDLDWLAGCNDQSPDFLLAPGSCDTFAGVLLLDLSSLSAGAKFCVRHHDAVAGGTTLTLLGFDEATLRLEIHAGTHTIVIPFSGSPPVRTPLEGLVPGAEHSLRITATDGNTVPVSAEMSFLYQGETALVFSSPPQAVIQAPTQSECDRIGGTSVRLDGSASLDPDSTVGTNDDIVSFQWLENMGLPSERQLGTEPVVDVVLPLGAHAISLRVTDATGLADVAGALVTVSDTTSPVLVCPAPARAECSGPDGAQLILAASATDVCGAVTLANDRVSPGGDASGTYPLGATPVTFTATDVAGNAVSCDSVGEVVDTTQPTLAMDVSPEELWPAEHQMEMVQVAWAAADLCDPAPAVRLVAATSSEPDDATGVGDGATTEDIGGANLGTPDTAIDLRAERAAVGPGRTYQIEYQAMDGSGNIASALGVVTVPRDQGHGPEGLLLNVDQDGAGRVRWYWSQWGSAASYDLLTGDLTSVTLLPNLVSLGPTEVMARERIDPWFEDSGERSPGQGRCYFYVVQGRTERGGWGYGEIPLPWPRAPESCAGGCP